jgi:hypothetical protein
VNDLTYLLLTNSQRPKTGEQALYPLLDPVGSIFSLNALSVRG